MYRSDVQVQVRCYLCVAPEPLGIKPWLEHSILKEHEVLPPLRRRCLNNGAKVVIAGADEDRAGARDGLTPPDDHLQNTSSALIGAHEFRHGTLRPLMTTHTGWRKLRQR